MSWAKRVGLVLAILGVVLLIVWSIRLARIGLSLREHLSQAQALAAAPASPDPVVACGLARDLRGDVVALHREAWMLVQLAPAFGWLPEVGGDLRAAPHLLDVADGLTEAGTLACTALGPALAVLGGDGETSEGFALERMTRLLAEEQPTLEQALAAAERAQEAWAQVDTDSLSPWLAGKVSLLDKGLPLLQTGLGAAVVGPELLGANGPRTYLILAQNEDELRPTGGFISGAGLATFDSGQVTELSFLDANIVDDYAHKPYPDPPEPMFTYMGAELWLFRDANWSPDFPTSARQAAYFYEYGQGKPVNGVIALDQRAVELLVGGLGEVYLPGVDEPITADNVRRFMREAWNPGETGVTTEWVYSRKEFIGQLASAILDRIETDPGNVDWLQIVKALYQALNERHLLVFVDDTEASDALAQIGWDGALRESNGDYLMIVDTNLGFGKVNPLIDEKVEYHVTLRADGTASAELSLVYAHQGQREGIHCEHGFSYAEDVTYETMMHRCYYDYLRLYVPASSVLRTATPHPTPGEYLIRGEPTDGQAATLSGEAGKTVLAQFFVVEYGQTLVTRFEYDLPHVIQQTEEGQWRYSLLIQKQAGTDSTPVSLMITLPAGTKLLAATPPPHEVDGDTLSFDLRINADTLVEVIYE